MGALGAERGAFSAPLRPQKDFGVGPFRPTFRTFNCVTPNEVRGRSEGAPSNLINSLSPGQKNSTLTKVDCPAREIYGTGTSRC